MTDTGLHILHLTKRYPNAIGGDAVLVERLRKHQKDAGHQVSVLTSNCPNIVPSRDIIRFGLPICDEAIDSINARRVVSLISLVFYSFRLLHKTHPDIVHSHTMDFGFAVSIAARVFRIPIINTCNSVSFTHVHFSAAKRRLEVWLLRSARYDAVITVEEKTVAALRRIGLRNVVYKPPAVDVEKFDVARRATNKIENLLFVGRLTDVKGVSFLVDAMAEILKKYPHATLTVVGHGEQQAELVSRANTSGVAGRINFVGGKTPDEVPDYYKAADLLVVPSLYEPFGMVILEGWAARLPVVATAVGSIPAFCTDQIDALLVPPSDSAALERAILRCMDEPDLANRLATNGRRNVDTGRYNFEALSEDVLAIYRDAISRRSRPARAR